MQLVMPRASALDSKLMIPVKSKLPPGHGLQAVDMFRNQYRGTFYKLVTVERVHVNSPGNCFHEVNGGTLMLRCQYFRSGSAAPKKHRDTSEIMISSQRIQVSTVYWDHDPVKSSISMFYLPILLAFTPYSETACEVRGLVLKQSGKETYVRIGSFEVCGFKDVKNIESFLSRLSDRQVDAKDLVQDDFLSSAEGDGKTWRVITIV